MPSPDWLSRVSPRNVVNDLGAGLTGAVIVLPQGVAYAMIAGLPPQYGLYTAIIVPVVAGLFGSSHHLVSGPTAAISVLVASALSGLTLNGISYVTAALTLTFLAGAMQLLCGLARLGWLVNFISHTVVVGFTAGAGAVIALSQTGNLLGLPPPAPAGLGAFSALAGDVPEQTVPSIGLFALTVMLCVGIRWAAPRAPALLLAMVITSLIGILFDAQNFGVPMVGAIPAGLPPLSLPSFAPGDVQLLVPGAAAIALLGLIEAVSVARAIAVRSGQKLDTNQEFIGQGLSNAVGSFFSSYAGSGSFTRSGANYDAGAKTPLAAVFASVCLLAVVVFVPGLSAYLPVPVVAGVIVLIAWNLIDIPTVLGIVRISRQDSVILLVTAGSAVMVNLEFAIVAGVGLSMLLYLRQTSHPRVVPVAPHPDRPHHGLRNVEKHGLRELPGMRILRIEGSLYFGAVPHVSAELGRHSLDCGTLVLDCSGVNFIDLAGAELLAEQAKHLKKGGGALYLCGLRDPAREFLTQSGYAEVLGRDHLLGDPVAAVAQLSRPVNGRPSGGLPMRQG
ncbi:SulP family inorganic anion transporter [Ectothiorhodospiraceae bacterium WFHF3C12]|nr:SulP family inorganic anion transporter [Ectothiorhodospiraceae bacterium WFHF3C12]